MKNFRWDTPFARSLSYKLFIEHYTEINDMYWANLPAANTIENNAMSYHKLGNNNPLDFFLVHDVDDRRVATTFDAWKNNFRKFQNFNRLNLVLSICSCFEVYLRSIVSLSLESKPGIILGDSSAIDGATLLKNNSNYSVYNEKTYPFTQQLNDVCKGDWNSRIAAYKKLFTNIPLDLEKNALELDKIRVLRNNIAHYFSRTKSKYENPIVFKSERIINVSHNYIKKSMKTVHCVVKAIDKHLYFDYIGSYEILKYFVNYKDTSIDSMTSGNKAKWLQKLVGQNGIQPVGTEYYKKLISYYESL